MGPDQSLLNGVEPNDNDDQANQPNGNQEPNGGSDPDPNPNGDPDPNQGEGEQPKTEEEIREAILAEMREGVPDSPEGYEVPDIEGIDKETLESSTVFVTMREAAHQLGMKPDKWGEFVGKWAAAEKQEIESYREEQLALLGKDTAQVQSRLGNLSGALTRMLPADEARELMGAAVSAGVVKALERLISNRPANPTATNVPQKDDPATIAKLMNTKEYMGYEHERDPEIVARVEKFFAEGGSLKEPR